MWKDDGGTNDFLLLVFVQHEDQKQQILGAAYVVAAIQLVPSYGHSILIQRVPSWHSSTWYGHSKIPIQFVPSYGHSKMPIQLIPSYGQLASNGRTEELSWIGVEWPYEGAT